VPGGRTPPGGPFAALCAAGGALRGKPAAGLAKQRTGSRKPVRFFERFFLFAPSACTTGCCRGRRLAARLFLGASRAQRGERTARGRPAPGHYRLPPSAHPCALGGGKRAHPCARRGGHRPHLGLVLAVWAGALFAQAQHTGPNQCAIQSRYVDILWITCG